MDVRGLATMVALAACGGTTVPPGWSSKCTVQLGGALSGTYDCRPATARWWQLNSTVWLENATSLEFYAGKSKAEPLIYVQIWVLGQPRPGIYATSQDGLVL